MNAAVTAIALTIIIFLAFNAIESIKKSIDSTNNHLREIKNILKNK